MWSNIPCHNAKWMLIDGPIMPRLKVPIQKDDTPVQCSGALLILPGRPSAKERKKREKKIMHCLVYWVSQALWDPIIAATFFLLARWTLRFVGIDAFIEYYVSVYQRANLGETACLAERFLASWKGNRSIFLSCPFT